MANTFGPGYFIKSFFAFSSLIVALSVAPAFSQGGIAVTASVIGVVPSGGFEDAAGNGLGGIGGVGFIGEEGLGLTVRSGYVKYLERKDYSVSMIPILGGFILSTDDGGVYIAGDAGAVLTHRDYKGPGLLGSNKDETNPGWSIGVGSMPGPLDLRFAFHVWDARHMFESMAVAVSMGFVLR